MNPNVDYHRSAIARVMVRVRLAPQGFTLVELLVVIAIIGVLVSLLLPAVQAAREAARRVQCSNNLVQLIVAVNQYEMAHGVYPPGTIDAQGPIRNVPKGYHHGWLTQILPYIEQRSAYMHIDRSVGVYHPKNGAVRDLGFRTLNCPSSPAGFIGYSDYAGLHHDLEAPIDANNNGVFFLNSHLRYDEIADGTAQTIFVGEKLMADGDLGWMSGTRATLRNTGTSVWLGSRAGMVRGRTVAPPPSSAIIEGEPTAGDQTVRDPLASAPSTILDGLPQGPIAVGGFGSYHPTGANFAFGDGNVRYISGTINTQVYQQLGHRADGKLLSEDSF